MGWLSNRLILYLLIAAVLVRSITDSIGGAGWFPLMQDNVPSRIAGKFFGIFRMYWQSCVLLAILAKLRAAGNAADGLVPRKGTGLVEVLCHIRRG
jgi:hypothetical protein